MMMARYKETDYYVFVYCILYCLGNVYSYLFHRQQLVDFVFGQLESGLDFMSSSLTTSFGTSSVPAIPLPFRSNHNTFTSDVNEPEYYAQRSNNINRRNSDRYVGVSVKGLLLNETKCSHAYLDPRLGIPNQITKLINVIQSNITWRGKLY